MPTVVSLATSASGTHTILQIEVRYANPSSNHYIDIIEVDVDGDIHQFTGPTPQETVIFLESFDLSVIAETVSVRVRVHCTLHDWSQRALLDAKSEPTPTPEEETLPGLQIAVLKLSNTIKVEKSQVKIRVLTEEGVKVGNAKITGKITDPSDSTQTFSGTANKNGIYKYKWKIATTAQVGTCTIEITASKEGYSDVTKTLTFNAISKK